VQVPVELKAPLDCNSTRRVDIAAISNASCNWLLQYASRHRAGTGLAYTCRHRTDPPRPERRRTLHNTPYEASPSFRVPATL